MENTYGNRELFYTEKYQAQIEVLYLRKNLDAY